METNTPTNEIRDAFRTLAQRLGGISHEHRMEEDAVWAIAKAIDAAFQQSVQSVQVAGAEDAPGSTANLKHPAIANLLKSIEDQQ